MDVEYLEVSYIVGGDVNWLNYFENVWQLLKKLNLHLPHGPAVLLLRISPKRN